MTYTLSINKKSWVLLLALALLIAIQLIFPRPGLIPVTQGISFDPEYVSYSSPSAAKGQLLSSGLTQPSLSSVSSIPETSLSDASLPDLTVKGTARQVVGVFVPGAFNFSVVQQPTGKPGYVSTDPDVVTQFGMVAQYGTIGLLAHNTLAGASYDQLALNDIAIIKFEDGTTQWYRIDSIKRYQALQPFSPYSNFIDLDHPGVEQSTQEVFSTIYQGKNSLVFQTCLERDGNPSWGRVFITATPVHSIVSTLGVFGYSLMSLLIY